MHNNNADNKLHSQPLQ